MLVGIRIRSIRNLRGWTQKQLGMMVGFSEKTADVRIAQYESGTRTPKEKMVNKLAYALGVSPEALTIPEKLESYLGVLHTLFALEDMYPIKIDEVDSMLCLRLDVSDPSYTSLYDMFSTWYNEARKLRNGEITKEEYDLWRYRYPRSVAERFMARMSASFKKENEE